MKDQPPPPSGSTPPPPPPLPATAPHFSSQAAALTPSPEDLLPIDGWGGAVESILRQPRRVTIQLQDGRAGKLPGTFLGITVLASLVYGFVMGTFSGGTQLWAAPVKVAGGLLFSALICLPSLYIFSCLAGSKAKLGEICGLVAGMLALMTVLLIGFAPVAWVFSQSTGSVVAMGVLHLLFWLIATWFGVRFLSRGFGWINDLTGGLKVWLAIFILVMLQMTTALRPLIGTAPTLMPTEKKFFLMHWFESMNEAESAVDPM